MRPSFFCQHELNIIKPHHLWSRDPPPFHKWNDSLVGPLSKCEPLCHQSWLMLSVFLHRVSLWEEGSDGEWLHLAVKHRTPARWRQGTSTLCFGSTNTQEDTKCIFITLVYDSFMKHYWLCIHFLVQYFRIDTCFSKSLMLNALKKRRCTYLRWFTVLFLIMRTNSLTGSLQLHSWSVCLTEFHLEAGNNKKLKKYLLINIKKNPS